MPTKKGKKMPSKKKKSKSLASAPRFSKRSLTLFGLAFALIGAFLLYKIFAASRTVHYFGALSSARQSVAYTLTTGSGNLAVSFSNNTADVRLTIKNKAGKTVGSLMSRGKRDVKASYTVPADTYTFSLATEARFTSKKGYSLYITYPTQEVTAPTAIISSPLASETVKGTVNFEASSKSELPIDRMEFYVDGNLLKSDITSPYSVQWDTTKYSNGGHTISVKSFDNVGRSGEASGVITVANVTEPQPPVPNTGNFDTVLLRPPAGKLLLGAQNPEGAYATAKSLRGKELHIYHDYARSGTNVKNILTNTPKGTIPLINFKPAGAMGPAEYKKIIAGDRDGAIKEAAAAAKAYGKKFYFAPLHEPENDDKTAPYASDADYAKAFTHIINLMRSEGATNIVSVWNVMGFKEWSGRWDKLYPGDGIVDWIASDPYSHKATETLNDFAGGSTKAFYAWASKKNKPMMWAEWGLDGVLAKSNAARFFGQVGLDALQKEMPLTQALVYWGQWEYVLTHFPNEWKAFSNFEEFNFTPPASVTK